MAGTELFTLMVSEELTWEGLIRDIVTKEGMDPWNIDIAGLTDKFLETIRALKKFDIKMSGKFLLAAAILLKMKSDYLLYVKKDEEAKPDDSIDMSMFEIGGINLEPNLPLPKQRKVTVEELILSLQKALAVKERRVFRMKEREVDIKIRVKKVNISEKIKLLFKRLMGMFDAFSNSEIKFSSIIPSAFREDVLWTFIPLIHIANKGHIALKQEEDFGEIYVSRSEKQPDGPDGKEGLD
jgi:segregation and condensation protein A